ncbi:MAG: endopeptidase La [Nitrospinota bacterium]
MTAAPSLPLLPLRDMVVFPHVMVPLFVGRERSMATLEMALQEKSPLLLVAQRESRLEEPGPEDLFEVGTEAEVLQMTKLSDGSYKALVEGIRRMRLRGAEEVGGALRALAEPAEEPDGWSAALEARCRHLLHLFEQYLRLNHRIPPDVLTEVENLEDPSAVADAVAANMPLKLPEKQRLLELAELGPRLSELTRLLAHEVEVLRLERKVRGRVRRQMDRSQREYYLSEQMKAIQKELGQADDLRAEVEELRGRVKAARMPKEVEERALKELKKLELMASLSAEATVVRSYVDWLVEVPWRKRSRENRDLRRAERILEEDHYGLEKVKERILEHLAVHQLVGRMKGPILCFVGPPGVGKTSLGRSIARATGRRFVRASLGGVRDEAEIRGHRRTYIGALPGRIVQGVKRAGTRNPVFLLDEVDKLSSDFRGDPASALLEVLDPEQNRCFSDHYLEVDFDLSEVMFITTANLQHTIPQPLLDRVEVIRLPGYTEPEKVEIARRFLIPKQMREHGLREGMLRISDSALRRLIREYTQEAGVRNLEREVASLCRKVARELVRRGRGAGARLTARNLEAYLGVPRYKPERPEGKSEVGTAMGLAWTEVGGVLMVVEVTCMEGRGRLTLTGTLGNVMQESGRAALSYVRSRAEALGIAPDFYRQRDIHIHVPEGAIPKDGPSAGITMATALLSVLTGRRVRHDVAMTGEVTLRGKVLPVGGVKEKILAAHRGGIPLVLLPKGNEKDLKEIPPFVRREVRVELVEDMAQVLAHALLAAPAQSRPRRRLPRAAVAERAPSPAAH